MSLPKRPPQLPQIRVKKTPLGVHHRKLLPKLPNKPVRLRQLLKKHIPQLNDMPKRLPLRKHLLLGKHLQPRHRKSVVPPRHVKLKPPLRVATQLQPDRRKKLQRVPNKLVKPHLALRLDVVKRPDRKRLLKRTRRLKV